MKYSVLKQQAFSKIESQKGTVTTASFILCIFMFLSGMQFNIRGEDTGEIPGFLYILSFLVALVAIGFSIASLPVRLAFLRMISKVFQDEPVKTNDIFRYFRSVHTFFKSVWVYVLQGLLLFLWVLPFSIITLASGAAAIFSGNEMFTEEGTGSIFTASILITVASLLCSLILYIFKLFQYWLSPYIIAEDMNAMSVWESIGVSKQYMKGYKWKLLVLHLSFIGRFLLVVITLGIYTIWFLPKYYAAMFEFYHYIKREKGHL